MSKKKQRAKKAWGQSLAMTAATAVSGSIATDTDTLWYKALDKPKWQPPGWLFPIVWTGLYAGIAATSARSIEALESRGKGDESDRFRAALGTNLVLNQAWSWTFFKAQKLGPATGVAAALAASSIDLARRSGDVDKGKGLELTPYALWCSFATVLTASIWRRNKRK